MDQETLAHGPSKDAPVSVRAVRPVAHEREPFETRTVAALYIDAGGPYPKLSGVDCWDEWRDAMKYEGPHPIVAHPPCGPWGRMRHQSRFQNPQCARRAVEQVRKFGGVLEHPAYSLLFPALDLPIPGRGQDDYGGYVVALNQVAWGHPCVKPTWLYIVGVGQLFVEQGMRTGGSATHCITTGSGQRSRLPSASARKRRLTPLAFAEWLVALARAVRT